MQYICTAGGDEAVTGGRQWAIKDFVWRNAGVNYATADFVLSQRYAIRMATRYCGASIRLADRLANFVSRFRPIDGPGGILARHELPGFPSPGSNVQLTGEWDSRERPNQPTLNLVTSHEVMGHGMGLIHFNPRPFKLSLMNSALGPDHFALLDEWDDWTISELRDRYGSPQTNGDGDPTDFCGMLCEQLCAGLLGAR